MRDRLLEIIQAGSVIDDIEGRAINLEELANSQEQEALHLIEQAETARRRRDAYRARASEYREALAKLRENEDQ